MVRKPSQATMAGLLGVAIGVMATVSIVELIVRNAMENDPFLVLASAGSGEEQLLVVRASRLPA